MNTYEASNVGSFRVTSGKIIVSDPCYSIGTCSNGIIEKAKIGKWNARILVSNEQRRVAVLIAAHENFNPNYESNEWQQQNFVVGVDAGMAGIYDLTGFHGGEYDSWYDRVCNDTHPACIIDGAGVVSSSGYGDGGYICKTITKDGNVVAVMVDYGLLHDYDEDYDEDEYEEDDYDDPEYDDDSDGFQR